MRYLSVCSGIEAATKAWHPLGWQAAGFAEIDPFACAVLHERYGCGRPIYMPDPDAKGLTQRERNERRAAIKAVSHLPVTHSGVSNYGDFTQITDEDISRIGPVDLLVGGTPCQSFSIAGKRLGLDDPRGNLALEYLRLAVRLRARWIVWENVPGVLSSRSEDGTYDFATFLSFVQQCGYGFAWRVLDAQYVRVDGFPFAVPQRRRRVFLVGHLGDWRRAAAVLFEPEGMRWDTAPRREAGQIAAPTIASRATGGGGLGTDFDCDGGLIASNSGDVGYCLTASAQQSLDAETETVIAVAHALRAQGQSAHDNTLETYVVHALRADGFDASDDGTGRGTPIVPVQFDLAQITSAANKTRVMSAQSDMCVAYAIQERAVSENPDAGPQGIGVQEGHAYTLEARSQVQAVAAPMVAASLTRGAESAGKGGYAGRRQEDDINLVAAFDMRGRDGGAQFEGPHDTANIRAASGGSSRSYVAQTWAVRRLTPRECERLQGFQFQVSPDYPGAWQDSAGRWWSPDYTAIPWRGKPADQCPDGPRYKALGNSMAVNVMAWIGQRIALMEAAE
jgi:DNA (cytosine-5)-methyltransferase 1